MHKGGKKKKVAKEYNDGGETEVPSLLALLVQKYKY